jgi:hypothetical protein
MACLSNKTVAELAAKFGCDTRTLRRWQAAGAPLDDLPAMLVWLDGRCVLPSKTEALLPSLRRAAKTSPTPAPPSKAKAQSVAPSAEQPGSLREARLRKVNLEADKLRFQNECDRGEWHLATDVVRLVTEWSGYFRAELEALAHAHAPLWGGLQPPEIESAAVRWVEGVMTRLAEIADRRIAAMSRPTK